MADDIYNLKFNSMTGLLINPDEQYLSKGLTDKKEGRIESALNNFTKSAGYGNYIAMSLIGYHHMENKQYIDSLAWLQLIDVDKLTNKDNMLDVKTRLEAYLTPEEMTEVHARRKELKNTYGALATLLKRQEWRDNAKTSNVPVKTALRSAATLVLRSGLTVDSAFVMSQINGYVYNHKFSGQNAFTILEEQGAITK